MLRLQAGTHTEAVAAADRGPTARSIISRRLIGLGSALLILIAGVCLLADGGGGGSTGGRPRSCTAYVGASCFNAWVLLVEILR